jgi:hypothetical protein
MAAYMNYFSPFSDIFADGRLGRRVSKPLFVLHCSPTQYFLFPVLQALSSITSAARMLLLNQPKPRADPSSYLIIGFSLPCLFAAEVKAINRYQGLQDYPIRRQ